VVLLVDALGWELLGRYPGLFGPLAHRRPVETVLGFSSGALPTLLTGRLPSEHGHWLMYRRARPDGAFRELGALRLLPGRLRRSWKLGRVLHRFIERRGVGGYFQLYEVPRELLCEFDLCERRDIFAPGAFGVDSLWEGFARRGARARVWSWRTPEDRNLVELQTAARDGDDAVLFCYTAELDADLHREGSAGEGVARRLQGYDRLVSGLLEGTRENDVWLYLLSDHGMVDVQGTVDVMGALRGLPWSWPADYLPFFDSTFARFWWRAARAREAVRERLEALGRGHWLGDEELRREGAWFPSRDYGEDVFLLDPGWLMLPSFMGSRPLRGMHGYSPSHPQMRAALYSNRPLPQGLSHLTQVRGFLEAELDAFREAA
jgi:hypothetical protein